MSGDARTTVAVCGSTGSIGTQTLEVVAAEPDRYRVTVLGAARSAGPLIEQVEAVRPEIVAVVDPDAARTVAEAAPRGVEVVVGTAEMAAAAATADVAVNGVVGFAGLDVTLATVRAGRRLALANKESLIAAGDVVKAAMAPGAEIVPVDSEHCAIHQCLRSGDLPDGTRGPLRRLLLTASGGPFRGRTAADLAGVTVGQALAHPTWSMGPKITIDSSTLMNKGLEVIEACVLFDVDVADVDVVVHPQSIIHSMVEFTDGAVIAQLSLPDMRLPIGYALAFPDRIGTPFGAIDWSELTRLDFDAPDRDTFFGLGLCEEAARVGGTAPAWLNAANEVVVEAFLAGRLGWLEMGERLRECMESHDGEVVTTAAEVVDVDHRSREIARRVVSS